MICRAPLCENEIPETVEDRVRRLSSSVTGTTIRFNGMDYHYWRGETYCSRDCENTNEEIAEKLKSFDASKAYFVLDKVGQPTRYKQKRDRHLWQQGQKNSQSGYYTDRNKD